MTPTPDDRPHLTPATAVVTGANSGIGFETASALALGGAAVTLACRDIAAGEVAAERIRNRHNGIGGNSEDRDALPLNVSVAALDLASLASIGRFADAWEGPLDLLVNNAGVMAPRAWVGTVDGFELQFGTNHLGHFALTGRLMAALKAGSSPRVVTVASLAHQRGRSDVFDGNPAKTYRPERAYGNSKLANMLFGAELQRRAVVHGSALTSTMAHPGVSATGLVEDSEGMGANALVRLAAPLVMRLLFQSAAAGANPTLYAARSGKPGSYTGPRWLGESRGPVGPARVSPLAGDKQLAARLWQASQELTGIEYHW